MSNNQSNDMVSKLGLDAGTASNPTSDKGVVLRTVNYKKDKHSLLKAHLQAADVWDINMVETVTYDPETNEVHSFTLNVPDEQPNVALTLLGALPAAIRMEEDKADAEAPQAPKRSGGVVASLDSSCCFDPE